MKVIVDEHIPLMTVRALRSMGHDVRDIRGTSDEGMQDEALWQMAQREGHLLITTDKGFAQYRTAQHHGILIVRLRRPNRHRIHHHAGIIAKVYAEIIEETDPAPLRILPVGAGSVSAFFFARLPEARAHFKTYSLYRLECGLCSSAVLGFVSLPTLGFHRALYRTAAAAPRLPAGSESLRLRDPAPGLSPAPDHSVR